MIKSNWFSNIQLWCSQFLSQAVQLKTGDDVQPELITVSLQERKTGLPTRIYNKSDYMLSDTNKGHHYWVWYIINVTGQQPLYNIFKCIHHMQ